MVANLVFYITAFIMIFSAFMVIMARNTARSAVFLALTFFCAALLWMLLQAEFLSLVIVFVYVGAVMTLFLFVVMMLNVEIDSLKAATLRYFPAALLAAVIVLALMMHILNRHDLNTIMHPIHHAANYSDTAALGKILYSKYLFSFELASIILFIAIVASISLVFVGRRPNSKGQSISAQQDVKKSDRLRIIRDEES